MTRPLGLGLDGGGSATRWAVAEPDGRVTAAGDLPPVSGHLFRNTDREAFAAVVRLLADRLPPGIGAVVAGITGLSAGTASARIAASLLAGELGVAETAVHVEDDIWIAYHAAFQPGEGHLVYAGTGSVGVHIRSDGSTIRVGGRGMLIDDAGAAFWIGRSAIDRIYRRIDETGAADGAMANAVFAALGVQEWDAVRSQVYGEGGRTRVALLAMAVAGAAADGDPEAFDLLRQAGRELARLANALAARAGVLPVALAGRAAGLHPIILSEMRAAAPNLAIELSSEDAAAAAARIAARMQR